MPQTEWSRLRALVNTAADGVILIDANGLIILFNPACEKLFGYSADEVMGRNVHMLMPSPYKEEHDGYLERYKTTGERRIIGIGREVLGRRKDGTNFPMYLSVGEAWHEGQRSFVGIIHDLTEQKAADTRRAEAERRVAELTAELVHTSRLSAMGQLSSSIAHELNQPLTAIANYSEAARQMLSDSDQPVPPRVLDLLQRVSAQAERAGQIIRRLRSLVEKAPVERVPASLNDIVEEATAIAAIGAKAEGIHVFFELASGLPPVNVDKIQMQQVVVNLVRNAVEVLRDSARRILILRTAAEPGQQICSIIDSGPGIPPEIRQQLFQPFVTTKKAGMGIGLSISQQIVEAHGGKIWDDPNPGGGTIFRFSLPNAS